MLTKEQKKNLIDEVVSSLKSTNALMFVNFTNVGVKDLGQLRLLAKSLGAKMQVVKKRLLKIALAKSGIDFDPMQFADQVGTVFIKGEIFDIAGQAFKLLKTMKKAPEVLGVYEVSKKNFLTPAQFKAIAILPSRETLLMQLVYVLGSPIRSFMVVLEGRAKQIAVQ